MISKNDIKIEVQTITGRVIVLYVKSTDKISELKSKIKLKENISEDKQYLFLNYQLLKDDSTIAENNIKETTNLYLMKSDEKISNSALPNEEKFIRDALGEKVNKTFHSKCDNKGELLYLIKTTQDIVFAIYINRPLLSDGNSRTDSLQMVISPAHNFAIKSLSENATYHCNSNSSSEYSFPSRPLCC